MDQNKLVLLVGSLISVGLFVLASYIRSKGRLTKTPDQVKQSKRLSWILLLLGILFFILTLYLFFYLISKQS